LIADGKVVDFTTKQRLVPFAESDLSVGPLHVFESHGVKIGVLVCFDGAFDNAVGRLADLGAEVLVMLTDDGSFANTAAARVHNSAALLAARSAGLPLVIASNAGSSVVADARGRIVASSDYGDVTVLTSRVPVAATFSAHKWLQSSRNAIAAAGLAMIGWFLILEGWKGWSGYRPRMLLVLGLVPAFALAMAAGAGVELLRICVHDHSGPITFLHDLRRRAGAVDVAEGLGPGFRQLKPESCGAAALAFGLTLLGQTSSEEGLARQCEFPRRALSLGELANCASQNGVLAAGFHGDWGWLSGRKGLPALLHLGDHYVTLLNVAADSAMIFDPALGAVFVRTRQRLEAEWTGNALALDYASPLGTLGDVNRRR
jgi:apolipoprotein N-acyltransferase